MNNLTKYLALVAPFLLSCGPPSATDDADSSADESTLESDCMSFCTRAVECDTEEYAANWEFVTEQECADYCVTFTNGAVLFSGDQVCEDITRALWVCAGMLETCDDFGWYEAAAFAKTGVTGKPCGDELAEYFQNCN